MPSHPDSMSVESLAEEFLDRLRRGEHPRIDDYAERYPALAHEIREFFPALRLVENFKPDSHDEPVAAKRAGRDGSIPDLLDCVPERLGDFRVLREISRGGMGIVYEAVQESLGRSVALKVLPPHALQDARQEKRFVREARAAARLHHTNIVPVFGVGETDGIHYYAMQFIHGLGLDQVLEELRRLRAASPQPASLISRVDAEAAAGQAGPGTLSDQVSTGNDVSAAYVAQSLVSGRFALEHLPDGCDPPSDNSGSNEESLEATPQPKSDALPARIEWGTSGRSDHETTAKRLSDTAAYVLQGRNASTSGSGTWSSYWQSAARIGVQVGEALQYAHDHRVLHRDIKPSNLLLDAHGTAWVTDFGLAKADDQDDLTRTGDVLGTLRYTAPELFHGKADCRSDVYSLGLTLYELLAMRPAFDETNRHKLVSQVMHQSPPRLRDVDRHIPRDLETIVDKAIDRDPSRRYQTAAELADDLKRFLANEPIKARRISPVVRFARWARRSPAAATLSAVLTLLAIVSPVLALYFGHLVLVAQESQRVAQRRLYEAKRSEASASRFSGGPGQQLNTLESLAMAAELHGELEIDAREVDRMRDEAIAVLALPDLRVERSWTTPQPGKTSLIHFDADLVHYTVWDGAALSVRRVEDDAELSRLPISPSCEKARFSPNGRLIGVTNAQERGEVQVWDWRRREIVYRVPKKGTIYATDFTPDSRLLAVGHDDGSVSIHDLERGEEVDSFQVASPPITLGFHPKEPRLAVNCQTAYCTQIWDLDRRRLVRTLAHPSDIFSLQWGPQGRLLAVVAGFDIHLWDLASDSDAPMRIFKGHTWVVSEVLFHPNGRLIYSHCWREGKTRVWDTFHGHQYFWCEGYHSQFSRDGRRLAFRTTDHVGIWSVASGSAYIWPPSDGPIVPTAEHCQYSADGSLLACAGNPGVDIWNTSSWQLLAHVPHLTTHSVCFEESGATLLAAHEAGLFRYPLELGQPALLGKPEEIALPDGVYAHHIARSADGESMVVDLLMQPDLTSTGKAALIDHGKRAAQILEGDAQLRFVAMSPDGRWAATGNWQGANVAIWDVASGRQVHRLDTVGSSVVAFSPDGKQLVTGSTSELTFWQVGGWTRLHSLPRSAEVGAIAFSADSRIVAATNTSSQILLIDTQSGRVFATLATNGGPAYVRWLAFRPDGRQLAVCCASEGVRVWDLEALRAGLRRIGLDWQQD